MTEEKREGKETLFHNRETAKQLIDFSGVRIGSKIHPTDIDGVIEYRNKMYILFEIKYMDNEVPFGQRLALERMVEDFAKVGKDAIVLVASHETTNPEEDIDAESCFVTEFFSGRLLRWVRVENVKITLGIAVKLFKRNPDSFLNIVGCGANNMNSLEENKEAEVVRCAS